MLLIRRIRSLLYEQGFTISGARNRLGDARDTPHDQDAAVRLSGAEMQALRNELGNVSAMLGEALGIKPGAQAGDAHAASIQSSGVSRRLPDSACARAGLVPARCLPAIRLPCFEVSVA